MTYLFVTYPGDARTRFDRDYYISTHLPLVREAWGSYGLESIAAFFPVGEGEGTIAVCLCGFRDEAALRAAIGSSQSPRVMADVRNFTDVVPSQSRGTPL